MGSASDDRIRIARLALPPAPRSPCRRPGAAAGPYDRHVQDLLRAMPKVLLHEHLDGGLRVATLFELLERRGSARPAGDVEGLARWFAERAHAGSLEQYLQGFTLTVAAMASPDALVRVAFEAAEDATADGCVLAEFRIAPTLLEAHGMAAEAAIEAMLAGLARAPIPSGLILCAMRERSPALAERTARLAVAYRDRGVIGFDLAGPELGYPAALHAGALRIVRDAGLPITLHAGEADVAERVIEAADLGALRIGHGVRLADAIGRPGGEALLDEVRRRGLHLEVCPTSNVHTGAVPSLAAHPIAALWHAGISLSFHTDNRLMSGATMSDEALGLATACGLGAGDLAAMTLRAASSSFLGGAAREAARRALVHWASSHRVLLAS
jgi:adenosine deaminase